MWCIIGRGSALDIAALRSSTRPVSLASYISAVSPRPIFLLKISFPWWKPTTATPVLCVLLLITFCEPSV